jgi:hypothetical protein
MSSAVMHTAVPSQVSELVLCLAFMAQMLVLKAAIKDLGRRTAISEVKLLDLTYNIKVRLTGPTHLSAPRGGISDTWLAGTHP